MDGDVDENFQLIAHLLWLLRHMVLCVFLCVQSGSTISESRDLNGNAIHLKI